MKIKSLICVFAVVIAMIAISVPAMAYNPTRTMANIPFEFVANGKTMPAGNYVFELGAGRTMMSVRGADGHAALSIVKSHTGPDTGASTPQLVFENRGGKRHLSEIYLDGQAGGELIPVK